MVTFARGLDLSTILEFVGLFASGALLSAYDRRRAAADERGRMPGSFVIDFAALLLLGPAAAMSIASAGAVAKGWLVDAERRQSPIRVLLDVLSAGIAVLAAGLAHQRLDGAIGDTSWPWQALPIAIAVLAYTFVRVAAARVVAPLVARRAIDRSWLTGVLEEYPAYLVGASLAVGFVSLIDQKFWQVLPVAAVPLYFAYRAYATYLGRLDEDYRRRAVVESLDQGMSLVTEDTTVTVWDDVLERLIGCRADHAVGRTLASAVPALRETGLPQAVVDVLKDRHARTVSIGVPSSAGTRVLQVKIVPVAGGAGLLWLDVTERTRVEETLRRQAERLALAVEGANDGLWDWDLKTQQLDTSARWKSMLGLSAAAGAASPAREWIDRVHPDDAATLHQAIAAHVSGRTDRLELQHRIRHADGTYRWFLCRGVAGGGGRRPSRIAGSLTDITDLIAAQKQLRSAGFCDPLTGLRNRADFMERLGRRLEAFKRRPSERFAVLYLDIDRLKLVNDSLGHPAGDELLVAVSRRLESCLRQEDCLGRLGGDEFAVLLHAIDDAQQANVAAFRIQDALNATLSVGGREVFTSASIGIAVGQVDYSGPDEIMRDADTAMYHAKSRGKARHELFDAEMHERARDRLGFESDLRRAVNNHDFEVHYQPIVALGSRRCVGFESLVRWTRNGEAISPARFIPLAEELGIIEPLGTWVLEQACQTFAHWQRRYASAGLTCITVNASSKQLAQQDFPRVVERAVQRARLRPGDLRIEVTETALMDSPQMAAKVLTQLRELGVKIYLDDFGTGCSSLSHLHKLPVDALKIDRSFVSSLLLPERPAIVESILALARTLNTSVVAEGIEDEVQAFELERLGCTHAQGYLFSRPLSAERAEAIIAANQPLGAKRAVANADSEDFSSYYSSKPFEWPAAVDPLSTRRN